MASAIWIYNGSDNWNVNSRWSPTAFATGVGSTASFGTTIDITVNPTVTVNTPITIGNLTFADNNLSGSSWTLARTSTNALTLDNGASSPIINVITPTTISVPLGGTNGFTKIGSASLIFASQTTLSGGAVIQSVGNVYCGTSTFNLAGTPSADIFPNITEYQVTSPAYLHFLNTTNAAFTMPKVSGSGGLFVTKATSTGAINGSVIFADLTGFTGMMNLWNNQNSPNDSSVVQIKKWPTSSAAEIQYEIGAGAAINGAIKSIYIPADATVSTTPVRLTIGPTSNVSVTNTTYALYANQTTGAMVFSGTVTRNDGASGRTAIGNQTFTLGGTNTLANTISGVISSVSGHGILNIAKANAGRWVLNNSNTYGGSTSLSGGALRASHVSAFSTSSISMSNANLDTVLEFAGVSPSNTISQAAGTIRGVSGTSEPSGAITMSGPTTFEALSDATLRIATASPIAGIYGATLGGAGTVTITPAFSQATTLIKSDAGTATLSSSSNSFSGKVTISGGKLAIASMGAIGGNGPDLELTSDGVLQYTGSTGVTLSRSLTASSITGGFENNGNSSLVVSSGAVTGTSTVKLGGTGTGQYNTLGATVAGGGFTKEGPGRWISTASNNLAGATTVSAGTLMAANADGATKKLLGGNVTVAAGAKIQTGSDNGQKGRNNYVDLTFAGTPGTPAKLRIGGSAVNPTVQMSGNLTISGAVTWDLTADTFKTPGTYTLIEFTGSGTLVGGSGSLANVTLTKPTGRTASNLTYNTPVGGPNTITVQIS